MFLSYLIHTSALLMVIAQHNLTPFGIATQSSSLGGNYSRPEYAINLPISTQWSFTACSHTYFNNTTPAWWMFQFSFDYAYITDIIIYYREDYARRMDGFKLYVTNTSTIPPDGYLCYEDPDPGLPNITQTISANQLGKYVIYYDNKGSREANGRSEGPIVELCYVAINGCQKSFWGSKCEIPCAENCIERNCFPGNGSCVWGCNAMNCLNNVCNKDTAVCTNGCKERRTGNHCKMYNLASDSSVSQNPSGSKVASLAIDGEKTSCSRTQGSTVTFRVDLRKASIATRVFIAFGEHTTVDGNHSVYVSNTSSFWESGTVLYRGESLPSELNFLAVFRYLTYVSPVQHPYLSLELCEIGIVGCPPTYYGPVCTKPCPQNCQGPCDLESGNCVFGCLNGWTGDKCEQACSGGRYGQDCLKQCSATCLNPQCNHVSGECINGCNDGWQGLNCEQTCGNWYFGNNCSMECNCLAEPCNKVDGICPLGGCKEGWHGDSCSQRCIKGQFGRNCNSSCDGCMSRQCEDTDGLCQNTTECEPGCLYEKYCKNRCFKGSWGRNCADTCPPKCIDQHCHPENGSCVWGCDPQNCLNHKCDIYTGACTEGCVTGLSGQYCNTFSEKTVESNVLLSTQVGLFLGGFLLGVLMTVAVCFLVQRKRQLRKKQGRENDTEKAQSHEQQHYDDVQHVQMENVSTYQDLMTRPTSIEYDQINTAYVNQ